MNDRRTIAALVIMGLILLLTPTYMKLVSGPEPTQQVVPAPDSLAVARPTEPVPAEQPEENAVVLPGRSESEPTTLPEQAAPAPEQPEKRHVISTPLYTGVLSDLGASIVGWRLKDYTVDGGIPVHLIPDGTHGLVVGLPVGDARLDTGTFTFRTTTPDTVRLIGDQTATVVFEADLGEGRQLLRRLTFRADTYDVLVEDTVQGLETSPLNDRYRLWWHGGLALTEPDRKDELNFSGFYALQGGDVQRTKLKADGVESTLTGRVDWVALRTKYFVGILMPVEGAFNGSRMQGAAGDTGPAVMEVAVDRPLSGTGPWTQATRFYMGPIDYSILKSYDRDLQKMMDFGPGFIRPISKLILNLFTFLHGFVPNYGIVIIVFSILVKLAVFPLTRKSYESMHAMQELAPKMQEIKEKYKDDPEKMNKKMMNLYKENKVNPLGGCFPILLQMPIFFALFAVFRSTIELRGAPFVFWLTDLSLKDPYLVLPGIMALTTFIQQRAQLKDPRQKMMLYIMPVMMFFLFMNFPAGLILYWTMFNVLSVVQTELIHPRSTAPNAAASG